MSTNRDKFEVGILINKVRNDAIKISLNLELLKDALSTEKNLTAEDRLAVFKTYKEFDAALTDINKMTENFNQVIMLGGINEGQ